MSHALNKAELQKITDRANELCNDPEFQAEVRREQAARYAMFRDQARRDRLMWQNMRSRSIGPIT